MATNTSLAAAIPVQRIAPIDRDLSRLENSTVKLDVVSNANQNGNGVSKQNALTKIANFKPAQLKNFSANIASTVSRRKQTSALRQAEQALTTEKVKAAKAENPISQKVAEQQTGKKVSITA